MNPTTMDLLVETLGSRERVISVFGRIKKHKATGCWLWQGAINVRKNGQTATPITMIKGRRESVRRILYQAHIRSLGVDIGIPRQTFMTCANPLCVNPKHVTVDAPPRSG